MWKTLVSSQRSWPIRHVDGRWKKSGALGADPIPVPDPREDTDCPPASHHPAHTSADDPSEVLHLPQLYVVARPSHPRPS